ncbi:outer membrane protein assembly factor BamB family protein [Nocardia cyriacigeorgica]|uniref:outer membrane protein assembly factor BamB family protein n=1 Tax=Nocardia cyriacigeorgica TaxID=135487 RepID=UPI003EE3143F
MAWAPGVRNLVLAAVAAVVTSAGAVAVLMSPDDTTRKITGTNDAAPGLGWSIEAAAIYGASAAEFRDPVGGTEFDYAGPGFIDGGDTLVTVIGVADHDVMTVGDPKLYGFDAATGATKWEAPAAGLGGCAGEPVGGMLVCHTGFSAQDSALIGFDIADGTVTRMPLDWSVFALAATGDRLYIAEGDVESDDARVHSGSIADPDAHWTRPFAMGTSWEDLPWDALDVTHGQGVFTLGAEVAGFDLRTGEPTWTARLDGCSHTTPAVDALVVRTDTMCGEHAAGTTDLLDHTGRTLVSTDRPGAQAVTFDRPADTTPILLGDAAYDRRDGSLRWTSPDLLYTTPDGSAVDTTAIAVLGDIALLHDPVAATMSGLDLRTGKLLWRTPYDRHGTIHDWDNGPAVFTDSNGIYAVDPATGDIVWETPFRAIDADPDALAGDGELTATGDGRYVFASARTMIGLRPLD